MENIYLKLMQEFESTGLSSKKSISKFIERNFKKPKSDDIYKWINENEDVMAFIRDVMGTGHFEISEFDLSGIGWDAPSGTNRWFDIVDVYARLTVSGLEFSETHKTNKRITQNSNLQTVAIALTVVLTAITLIVTLQNSTSDKKVNILETHIREQNQQLHTVQIQLSQATSELYLEKNANKNPPKKP